MDKLREKDADQELKRTGIRSCHHRSWIICSAQCVLALNIRRQAFRRTKTQRVNTHENIHGAVSA